MLCPPLASGAPQDAALQTWPPAAAGPCRFGPQSRRRRAPSARSRVVLRTPAARVRRGGSRVKVLAGQEQQPELADLDLVAPGQFRLLDALPVDVGAIEAAHVADGELGAPPVELRVPPGDRHVVEEDVTVRVPARGGQVAVEPEPAAGVGPAHDQEQRGPLRQGAERRRVREQVVAEVTVLRAAQGQRRGGLSGTRAAAHSGAGQLSPAIGAEPGVVRIRPPAPGTVNAWHSSARPPLGEHLGIRRCSPRYLGGGPAVEEPREQPAPRRPAPGIAALAPHRRLTSSIPLPPARMVTTGQTLVGAILSYLRISRGSRGSDQHARHTAYLPAARSPGAMGLLASAACLLHHDGPLVEELLRGVRVAALRPQAG